MAASPVRIVSTLGSSVRRRPFLLTQRRLEANRRNAARSTGPRTPAGKARVARNPIKHGFFVAQEHWSPTQSRDYEEILAGLRDDLQPQGVLEEACIATIARSYVQMAAMLRYENLAALKHHQHRERELEERIATAAPEKAAFLASSRDQMRRAGLWRPTLPGQREIIAITRYSGCLDRSIRRASAELRGFQKMRICAPSSRAKVQKQTHCAVPLSSGVEVAHRLRTAQASDLKVQKQTHFEAAASIHENAKTNPLTSMFTGNRHARRRAKALAARGT
jgi:hypothetical protein